MVVLGKIEHINSDNTCTVHVPVFDTAGINSHTRMPATIATPPGIYNNYAVGDVVYVTFENNTIEDALILGKLYISAQNEGERTRGALVTSSLKVLNDATLPNNTVIGGLSYQDLLNYGNRLTKIECNPFIVSSGSIEKEIIYSCLPKSIVNGKLTDPITISGGDTANSNKLILDQTKLGQITDLGTNTLFGFLDSANLTIGHPNYNINFRSNSTNIVCTDTNQEITGTKFFTNTYPSTISKPGIYLGFVDGIDSYTSRPYKTSTLSLISASGSNFTPHGARLLLGTQAWPSQFIIDSQKYRDDTVATFTSYGHEIKVPSKDGTFALLSDLPDEGFKWWGRSRKFGEKTWVDGKQIYINTQRINVTYSGYIKNPISFPIIAGTSFDLRMDLTRALEYDFDSIWVDQSHTIQIGSTYNFNPYCVPNQSDYFNVYIDKPNKELHIRGVAKDHIVEFNIVTNFTLAN